MKRFLPQSDFVKNIFTLISGTTLAQAIPFLLLPVLQRWFYNPADFGLLSVYLSFTGIFATAATGKYEYSIVLEKEERPAIHLFMLAIIISGAISIILFAAAIFLGENIADILGSDRIYPFLFIAPVSVFAFGVFQSTTYWYNRERKFSRIAGGKILQTTSAEGTKLVTGVVGWGASGLIIGRVAGEILAATYFAVGIVKRQWNQLQHISWAEIKRLAAKNKEYPFFTMPSAFIGTLAGVLYIFMFSSYYSAEVVGFAGIATTYIAVPLGIISSSFSQVFFNRIAEVKDTGELRKIYIKYMLRLFIIGMLIIAIVYIIPTFLVAEILGEEWADLMTYIRAFVVWIAVSFVSSALSFIYIKLKKQKVMFFADVIHLLLVFGSIWLGHQLYHEPLTTIWFFTAAQLIYYIFAIFLALLFLRKKMTY